MGGQPSVEELLNIITLQRKALEFYGEGRNYKFNSREINSSSLVQKDMGHQARYALEQSNVAMEYHDSLVEQIKKFKDEFGSESPDATVNSMDDFKKMVEEFKKLNEE